MAVATWAVPAGAFPLAPDLNAIANRLRADAPILVRDICGTHYEGRTKITRYCDDPYVCDHANPGKCKPGPALQRQLDAERQRREDAMRAAQQEADKLRRDLEARVRNLRRSTRTTYFARKANTGADDRRGSGCNWEINLGSRALYCPDRGRMSSSAYDSRIIPSPQYGRARHPQRGPGYGASPRTAAAAAPNSRPISLRSRLTLALMIDTLEKMDRKGPDYAEWQGRIIAKAKEYEAQGETVAPALKEMMDKMAARVIEREREEHGAVTGGTPLPPLVPPGSPQAAAAPPKPYSDKDEALCSYLMTLAPDRRNDGGGMNRLGQPVPAYCEPYLRSLPQPETQPAPEPVFYLPEKDKEEACKIAEEFSRENLFPPDYADLSVTERAYHSRRAYLCLTDRR
jgi:hypothetical protein